MRIPLMFLAAALGVPILCGAVFASPPVAAFTPSKFRLAGCGATSPDDSTDFLMRFQYVVSGPVAAFRTATGLPTLSADSVQFTGTSAQCDSVTARYDALRTAETGITWFSSPVLLLRVGSSHYVADPKVVDQNSMREWIILDSTLTITTIFRTQ